MVKDEHCPVCELGTLKKHSDTEQQSYRGQVKTIQFCYSECDFCEGVILTAEQASKNKAEMQKFIESVDKQLEEKPLNWWERFLRWFLNDEDY